jgi:hypothetical protein
LPRILIVQIWEVATQIFFLKCVQQTIKTAAKEKRKHTRLVEDPKRNNKGNSSGELILSIVNKKTLQGLTNEFDCDATLELTELEVNKIKVKCAFVTQLLNILQQLTYQQEILFPLQLKSKSVKHLLL